VLLVIGMAALVGVRPVRLPGLGHEITATHPFILLALAAFGSMAAVLVAVAGVVAAVLGRGRRSSAVHVAFNLGAVILSTVAASWLFLALGGVPGERLGALLLPLAAATTIYFVANTGLVAAAIALDKRKPFVATWRSSFLWSTTSYFVGLPLAVVLLAVLDTNALWLLALSIPPCWLLVCFYRAHAAIVQLEGTR
jgi:hypothetical protein